MGNTNYNINGVWEYKNLLFYIILFILIIILAELISYFWHRILSHNHIINIHTPLHDSHSLHHDDKDDGSYEDFMWVLFFLGGVFIVLYLAFAFDFIAGLTLVVIYIAGVCDYFYSWYIHKAYHTKDHWLEYFDWFNYDRKEHMVHHKNPKRNYGVSNRFLDKVFGTFKAIS